MRKGRKWGHSETQDEDKINRGKIWRMLAGKEFLEETGKTGMSGKTWAGEDSLSAESEVRLPRRLR